MKFNSVTWYSKLAAAILFIVLPFIGFYLGMQYQKALSLPKNRVITIKSDTDKSKTIVDTDQITVKTIYENGVLKYSGTVQLPTPCHEIKDETDVFRPLSLDGVEQVQIRITTEITDTSTICAQVITDKEFSGEVKVSEQAIVSVYLNDKKVD